MSLERITLRLRLFTSNRDKTRSRRAILWLMESLVQINKAYIELNNVPKLYDTDVIYQPETGEEWKDVYNILKDGFGDCEDLSCWRTAELRAAGINARPYIKWRKQDGRWIYHALVWTPGDKIEDPSLALGMSGKIIRKPIYVKP